MLIFHYPLQAPEVGLKLINHAYVLVVLLTQQWLVNFGILVKHGLHLLVVRRLARLSLLVCVDILENDGIHARPIILLWIIL